MARETDKSKIQVRHFRRISVHSDSKELVTEEVEVGSETANFLSRLEDKRRKRPCFLNLDMRGRVRGECNKYVLNNRVFYLDDISYGIFRKGLKKNVGVFTIGTYEDITGGDHTNKKIREAELARAQQQRAGNDAGQRLRERAVTAGPGAGADAARRSRDKLYQPGEVLFGYYQRRREPRVQYVTSVTLSCGNIDYSASTRDISLSGLQVGIKGGQLIEPGGIVTVSFNGFEQDAGEVQVSGIRYRLVASQQRASEVVVGLSLDRGSEPEGFAPFLEKQFKQLTRKYKLDVEDDMFSVTAWIYERLYTENLVQVPFYIGRQGEDHVYLQAMAITDGNEHLVRFFGNDVDSYDLSPLALATRLEQALESGEITIAMFRHRDGDAYRIHSGADFEFDSSERFTRFMRYAMAHEEHCVVKMSMSRVPVRQPSSRKLDMVTGRLLERAEEQATGLLGSLGDLVGAGLLSDITEDVRDALGPAPAGGGGDSLEQLHCWVGVDQLDLVSGEVQRSLGSDSLTAPNMIRFGYVERRREDRFLAETPVEISVGGSRHVGATRDISIRGARVQFEGELAVKVGDEVQLSFHELQKKRQQLDLGHVAYRVVNIRRGPMSSLMLQRVSDTHYELNDFFAQLISKNRSKLAMDVEDTLSAAASRVYESVITDNLATVPFFIARGEDGAATVQRVAVCEGGSPLSDFFGDGVGGHDFSAITDGRLVVAIYTRLVEMGRAGAQDQRRPMPVSLVLYVQRETDPATGARVVTGLSEMEFKDDAARVAHERELASRGDFRVLKVMATYTLELDRDALGEAMESVREQSRHRAFKLQEDLSAVIGYGELVDITRQVCALRPSLRDEGDDQGPRP